MRTRIGATRWASTLLAAFLALSVAGCASHDTPDQLASLRLSGDHYVIPMHRKGRAGTLIGARVVPGVDDTLGSALREQFLYHGVGPNGRDIAVSGQVLIPHGRRPRLGWPVVAWAHGTTGLADRCAPSLAPRLGADPSAVREVRALLAHGFAVVATDYPGLGTPGVHPYLIGPTNGDAVVDSVIAAHAVLPRQLSAKWMIVGHSEGGQTALFAAQTAAHRARSLDYRGVVALAPASLLEALPALTEATHDPVDQAYLTYAIVGLESIDTTIHLRALLTKSARPIMVDLTGGCVDQITDHYRRLKLTSILDASPAQRQQLATLLGRWGDPDRRRANGPILLLQGLGDTDVPPGATRSLRRKLVSLGDHVTYREYRGVDHTGLIAASIPEVMSWLSKRFAASS